MIRNILLDRIEKLATANPEIIVADLTVLRRFLT